MAKDKLSQYDEIQSKVNRWFESDKSARSRIDWKWFTYDLYVSGNHYARYDRDSQQIITTVKDKGRPRLVINKIASTRRNVANWALRTRPKAQVTPDDMTEDNIEDALVATKYLDFLHDKLKLKKKLRLALKQALTYSVGYWVVKWDDKNDEIRVDLAHAFDVYWDNSATSIDEARRVTLAVRRSVDYLKNQDIYIKDQVEKVQPDKKLAESDIRSRFLSHERGMNVQASESDTVIVKEHWYKEFDKEGNEKIMICTTANGILIREPEDTGLDRFPFFVLRSDVEPLQMYGDGWVKGLIDPQKMINRGESNVAEYNDLINKVKIIIDRGAGVKTYNNQHGQIIEKKRNYTVTPLAPAPMSPIQLQQISNAIGYIEDLGAMHDAMLGRVPAGAKSGKAIEALQFGNSTALSELTDNIEEFLGDVYEYILSLVAEKYQWAREIKPTTRTGEREFIKVIGEGAENKPDGATVIKKSNIVDVSIGSYLATTPTAKQEAIKELAQILPDLDEETILEAYGVGNIADVISRIRKRRREKMGEQQQQNLGPEQGAEQAVDAIRQIVQGQAPEPPANPNVSYLEAFEAFMQTPEFQQLEPDAQRGVDAFRQGVSRLVGERPRE